MGIHDGHRNRMRDKFINNGFNGMEEHEILEMVLYYAIPRRDTNELAHQLINKFGSLAGVFNASYESLMEVEGITKSSAVLICMFLPLLREYKVSEESSQNSGKSSVENGEFLLGRYIGQKNEVVSLICLNSKLHRISYDIINEGDVSSVGFDYRKIIHTILKNNAVFVIVAHNHPSGIALPSKEDINATVELKNALQNINVSLLDHIIIADNDYISMAHSLMFRQIFK